jgi:hypothetical protein
MVIPRNTLIPRNTFILGTYLSPEIINQDSDSPRNIVIPRNTMDPGIILP